MASLAVAPGAVGCQRRESGVPYCRQASCTPVSLRVISVSHLTFAGTARLAAFATAKATLKTSLAENHRSRPAVRSPETPEIEQSCQQPCLP